MAFVSRLCGPIALVAFVATIHLSYSFAVRNGQPIDNSDPNRSSAQSIIFNNLDTNMTVESTNSSDSDETQDFTNENDDDLRTILFKQAMEVLEKEERVYDLEAEKLELEIEVLKKQLYENDTLDESQSEANDTLEESATTLSTETSTETFTEPSTEASTEPSTDATTIVAPFTVIAMSEEDNDTVTRTVTDNAPVVEAMPMGTEVNASVNVMDQETGSTVTASVIMNVTFAPNESMDNAVTEELSTSTTQEPSSTDVITGATVVVDENGSTSFEFLKAGSGPIASSINALIVSLIATVVALKF